MKNIITLIALIFISMNCLYGQVNWATYEFNYNSCQNPNDSVTTQPEYGTFSKFKRQIVQCDNGANNTWTSDGWSTSSTQDTSQYTYFSLQLDTPHKFQDTTIEMSFSISIKNNGPTTACMMYRYGTDAFQMAGSEFYPTTTLTPVTRTIPAPPDTNQTYLEVRFYGWNAVSSKASMSFDIVSMAGDSPLPVELVSFTSLVNERDVLLNWSTAWELNNAGFEIQRKTFNDGAEWVIIGFVEGNGTTNEPKYYSFEDKKLSTGKYHYRLKQIDYNGNSALHDLSNAVEIGKPKKFVLSQNYPNPFNPVTKIDYNIPFNGNVSLKIYDISGREITTLVNKMQDAGYYTVQFNADNFASGTYFYRISADNGQENFVMTKRMLFIK